MPIWSIMDVAPCAAGRIAGGRHPAASPGRRCTMWLADIVDIAKDIVVPEAAGGSSRPCFEAVRRHETASRSASLRARPCWRCRRLRRQAVMPGRRSRQCSRPIGTCRRKAKTHQPMRAQFVPELQLGVSHDSRSDRAFWRFRRRDAHASLILWQTSTAEINVATRPLGPHPAASRPLSPQGGGGAVPQTFLRELVPSPPHLPGRHALAGGRVLAVLQLDALRQQLVADAVGLRPVLVAR